MASNSNNLYVTFVDVDCNLLKIWGQKNRIGASYIEKQLAQMVPELEATQSPNPSLIHKGMLCYAKNSRNNYYRARVISSVRGDSVGVLFVDYGDRSIIHISQIKIRSGADDVVLKMAEQAEGFYLARVIAPAGGWTKDLIAAIRREVCNKEMICNEVAQLGGQKFIEVRYHNDELASYLIARGMAQGVVPNVQTQMIMPNSQQAAPNSLVNNHHQETMYSSSPQMGRRISGKHGPPEVNSGKQFVQGNGVLLKENNSVGYISPGQYMPASQVISVACNTNKPGPEAYCSPIKNSYINENHIQGNQVPFDTSLQNHGNSVYLPKEEPENLFNNGVIEALAQQIRQYIADGSNKSSKISEDYGPHNYVSDELKVGSTHNVFISSVDDGPWSFSVQLVSSEDKLNKLMEELTTVELVPVKVPIVLGHPCIAASAIYANLCRGVVVSISHTAAKVYLVDFGDTESLPISSIYELPQRLFRTRVLSQKFCLTGLQNVPYSEEIKEYFKEVVQNQVLILKVASLEGDNLPCCELYIQNKNIKRMLNEKIQNARSTDSGSEFEENGKESVVVTWVESMQKFFVQFHKRDYDLNCLKNELSQVNENGNKFTFDELSVGLLCICKYKEDEQWYRAKITSLDSQKNITVFYIDYGNTETVDINSLRKMKSNGLIADMKNLAIQCCLMGFEHQPYNKELSNELENLTLDKDLDMTVVSTERDRLYVKLFLENEDIVSVLMRSHAASLRDPENVKCWLEESKALDNPRCSSPRDFDKGKPMEKNKRNFTSSIDQNRSEKKDWRADMRKFSESGMNDTKRYDKSNKDFKQDRENRFGDRRSDERRLITEDRIVWNIKVSNGEDKRGRFGDHESNTKQKYDERSKTCTTSYKPNINGTESQKLRDIHDDKKGFLKKAGLKKTDPVRNEIPKDEIAPAGSTFKGRAIKIGSTEKVVITYYINPHEFYIQILSDEEDFKKMMQEIQIYYSDKYFIKDKLAEGDIVVANFSYDNVLYRGEVVTCNPLVVRYVDYGNQEEVEQTAVWAVAKQFLNLPKEAVKCKLANVNPIGAQWPALGSPLDEYFDSDEYKCTFLNCDNGVYEVELEALATGKNPAAKIIAAGLGVPKRDQLVIPDIDFSLLPKQSLRVRVSYVKDIKKFFVNLNMEAIEKIEDELKGLMDDKQLLDPVEKDSLQVDSMCLVAKDEICWARGMILDRNENKMSIRLIDEGNILDVTVDKVREIPYYLASIPPQAVECCSNSEPESLSQNDFKESIQFRDALISVVSEEEKRLLVDVVNVSNGSHPQAVGQLPIIQQNIPVVISHFESPTEIYIQHRDDNNKLEKLNKELVNFYAASSEVTSFSGNLGDLIAARISPEVWRRARVVAFPDEENVDVVCIDTGKTARISRMNVKTLDTFFYRWNAFARKVALDLNVPLHSLEEVNLKLEALKNIRDLYGYFVNENGEIFVEFLLHGARITPTLLENDNNLSKEDKFGKIVTTADIPPSEPIGFQNLADESLESVESNQEKVHSLKVFVIHIDSPNKFWIHKETSMLEFQELQGKLQEACKTQPNNENPKPGDVVAAMFDDVWYRAVVLSSVQNVLTVQFFDYGNVIQVNLDSGSVKTLPPHLADVPTFTTQFSLRGNWKKTATTKFEEIILDYEDPVIAVILEEGDPVIVDLFKDGKSIFEELTEAGVAVDEDPLNASNDTDFTTVYITHMDSPSNFYIQKDSSTEVLETISKTLSEMATGEMTPVSSIEEGQIYAAKFPEDGLWYRAKVIANAQNHIRVLFIDYGNISDVSEVADLTEDIRQIPPLGENSSLQLEDNIDAWSEEACRVFANYADGRPLQMKLISHPPGKNPILRLFCDGQDISTELAKFCPDDARFPAHITHFNSLTDFYVRRLDDHQFNSINRLIKGVKLEKYQDPTPGARCLVEVPAREGLPPWRRAQILQILNGTFHVFLLDSGKTLRVSNLMKPIDDIMEIPPTALKCTLNLPHEPVSETLESEFMKWFEDKDRIFSVRIIEAGETNTVSLKVDGLILEEALSSDNERESHATEYHACTLSNLVENLKVEDETDDDKNSKRTLINEGHDNDVLSLDSVQNETDEEKEIKIGLVTGEGGPEGFKSDDEKEIGQLLSHDVNATDNQLMIKLEEGTFEGTQESKQNGFPSAVNVEVVKANFLKEEESDQETDHGEENDQEASYGEENDQEASLGEENDQETDHEEENDQEADHGEKNNEKADRGEETDHTEKTDQVTNMANGIKGLSQFSSSEGKGSQPKEPKVNGENQDLI